jgi:hypothetical protein
MQDNTFTETTSNTISVQRSNAMPRILANSNVSFIREQWARTTELPPIREKIIKDINFYDIVETEDDKRLKRFRLKNSNSYVIERKEKI